MITIKTSKIKFNNDKREINLMSEYIREVYIGQTIAETWNQVKRARKTNDLQKFSAINVLDIEDSNDDMTQN